ncbi:MAG: AmmeMemoRadiSam system radical SAM enzyme [Chloroflexi bacterium]|nr:AmmeMemoRadiSam system radical SAM enzyme [Chloroflexota bacterium]MBL7062009.1 AmmeMemoRadiSam system radical SAM enzyme [Dehalococcoidia bacterium]
MYEALLYEKLPDSRVRCNVCQWRCVIGPGKFGVCRVRQNDGGVLHVLNYAQASSVAVDPIEKKPLFHFFPGSLALSLGTWGCNFHCKHCQNWQISCVEEPAGATDELRRIPPEEAVKLAKQRNCGGITWTYNEPSIWFEYTLDSAKLAKKDGLYTGYVTNGYLTPEALDIIGPYLDAWRVDIKGFSDALYRNLAKIPRWRGILEVAKRAQQKWSMHVEVVTNIVPTMNDDDEQLHGIAGWVRDELGELTPWHVTRFYPHHNLMHLPATPIATLEKAYDIGKKAGLRFVYLGNVPGHGAENTVCYSCDEVVIQRFGYDVHVVGVDGSKCKFCGAELNIKAVGWSRQISASVGGSS